MRVRKAVFPAAGWGTRFLPATKAQPKEMLPLVDKPVIQYAVEEAVAAGIEQVIIVTSSQKRTQRVQTMQRLPQMRMFGPRSFVCLICFSSSNREWPWRYLYV